MSSYVCLFVVDFVQNCKTLIVIVILKKEKQQILTLQTLETEYVFF